MPSKLLGLVLVAALSSSSYAQPASWKTYSDASSGIRISMPGSWTPLENKTVGKVFSFGQAASSAGGHEAFQGCAVVLASAPSSRGKPSAVLDREIDDLVQSTPPEKLGAMLGVQGVTEVASVPVAGRRALRVLSTGTDPVTNRMMKLSQTLVFQGGKSYGITCYASPTDFAEAWPLFEMVARSFQFIK